MSKTRIARPAMACACGCCAKVAARPRIKVFMVKVVENVNKKKMKRFEGRRWRWVMKNMRTSKMVTVNAVIGWDGEISVVDFKEPGDETNNINNGNGKGVYEWMVQRGMVVSCNDGSLSE